MNNPIIDLNADLGEGFGAYASADDNGLLDAVSSANIACGFHAGDPRTMAEAVAQAAKRGVGIGAHPGFPDRVGFGRRAMTLSAWEVTTDILYQLGALEAFARGAGGKLQHLSPHGMLANMAVVDGAYAEAIVEAVVRFDPQLIVATQPGRLDEAARARGLKVANLLFADRAYEENGTLVPRKAANAVIHDPDEVVRRAVRMVVEGAVTAASGKEIPMRGHSLCLHGDTPGAVGLALRIREGLLAAGVQIRKLGDWL